MNPVPPPPIRVGVNTGLDEVGGGGPPEDEAGNAGPPAYFEPEASATFCTMPSGVRSRSDLAVT